MLTGFEIRIGYVCIFVMFFTFESQNVKPDLKSRFMLFVYLLCFWPSKAKIWNQISNPKPYELGIRELITSRKSILEHMEEQSGKLRIGNLKSYWMPFWKQIESYFGSKWKANPDTILGNDFLIGFFLSNWQIWIMHTNAFLKIVFRGIFGTWKD